jgi:hypothetical protein
MFHLQNAGCVFGDGAEAYHANGAKTPGSFTAELVGENEVENRTGRSAATSLLSQLSLQRFQLNAAGVAEHSQWVFRTEGARLDLLSR